SKAPPADDCTQHCVLTSVVVVDATVVVVVVTGGAVVDVVDGTVPVVVVVDGIVPVVVVVSGAPVVVVVDGGSVVVVVPPAPQVIAPASQASRTAFAQSDACLPLSIPQVASIWGRQVFRLQGGGAASALGASTPKPRKSVTNPRQRTCLIPMIIPPVKC